jgi:hypothetical protein
LVLGPVLNPGLLLFLVEPADKARISAKISQNIYGIHVKHDYHDKKRREDEDEVDSDQKNVKKGRVHHVNVLDSTLKSKPKHKGEGLQGPTPQYTYNWEGFRPEFQQRMRRQNTRQPRKEGDH